VTNLRADSPVDGVLSPAREIAPGGDARTLPPRAASLMLSDALTAQPVTSGDRAVTPRQPAELTSTAKEELQISRRAEPLVIDVHITAEMVTVVISGELDLVTTPSLIEHLTPILENEPQRLVFDMTRVGFIDCAAARLIASTGQFLPHNQRPVIRFPGPLVRRVLRLTGLDDYCEVEN
jgi:anti-sigma B factor antagonist